jgi:hypothetical protein
VETLRIDYSFAFPSQRLDDTEHRDTNRDYKREIEKFAEDGSPDWFSDIRSCDDGNAGTETWHFLSPYRSFFEDQIRCLAQLLRYLSTHSEKGEIIARLKLRLPAVSVNSPPHEFENAWVCSNFKTSETSRVLIHPGGRISWKVENRRPVSKQLLGPD